MPTPPSNTIPPEQAPDPVVDQVVDGAPITFLLTLTLTQLVAAAETGSDGLHALVETVALQRGVIPADAWLTDPELVPTTVCADGAIQFRARARVEVSDPADEPLDGALDRALDRWSA